MLPSQRERLYHMIGSTFGLRLLTKPSVQAVAIGLLVTVVLAFRTLQFVALTSQIQWGYDFSAYWQAGARTLEGVSPYQALQLAGPYAPQAQYLYLYPPPFAALFAPLAAALPDYRLAAWLWFVVGVVILTTAVLALWKAEHLGERFPVLAGRGRWLLVAAAFAFPPVVGELVLGNVHMLLLGLLTLAWLGIRRGDRRGDWQAGLAVGAAAVIKVFPALLLIWFLLTRRYRAAAAATVAVVAIALATVPLTGIQPWLDYPRVLANLSGPADTADTLAPTVWLADWIGFDGARVVVTLAALSLVAWAALRADARRSFALTVTLSVLVAPAVYHHYLAILVLPLVLGLVGAASPAWIAGAYLLMWGGTQRSLGDLAWIVNRVLPTSGALMLLGGVLRGRARPVNLPAPAPVTIDSRI